MSRTQELLRIISVITFLILSSCASPQKSQEFQPSAQVPDSAQNQNTSQVSGSTKSAGSIQSSQTSIPAKSADSGQSSAQIKGLDLDKNLSLISFGSCSDQKLPQPIWNTILNLKPELHIALGDNVYASKPKVDGEMADTYKKQAAIPEYAKFRAATPIVATWDDHDFGWDDGGRENPRQEEAKVEFLKFFPNDAQAIPKNQRGVQHAFIFGKAGKRVQVILLDTRSYRSPIAQNEDPNRTPLQKFIPTKDHAATVLGPDQWVWLEQELKRPAEVRLIVSSIQFLANEHMFEMWGNYPKEREKMLDLLKKLKVPNTYILSGDRHFSQISKMNVKGYGDVLDITASSINKYKGEFEEPNRYRVGPKYHRDNFGMAEIDWDKKTILFDIRDLQGNIISSIKEPLVLKKKK